MYGPPKSKHAGGHQKPMTEKQKRKAAKAARPVKTRAKLRCRKCGRTDGSFESWGTVLTHYPCSLAERRAVLAGDAGGRS